MRLKDRIKILNELLLLIAVRKRLQINHLKNIKPKTRCFFAIKNQQQTNYTPILLTLTLTKKSSSAQTLLRLTDLKSMTYICGLCNLPLFKNIKSSIH